MKATYIGYEVSTAIDGKMVHHQAKNWIDALEWAGCYPVGFTSIRVRVWWVVRVAGVTLYAKNVAVCGR